MSDFDLKLFLKNLPNLPGVYRMIGKNGQVLYVGKAVNLSNRVRSYFSGSHSPRISLMIKQIERIEITVTQSEAEALILENNLIKSLAPRYNILFRDDKSYPYLKLSAHDFPQVSYYRGSLKKPHRYFGPYPESTAVRNTVALLQKIFRLRTCEDSVFAHRDRPCLLYQIRRCSAPCTQEISREDYAADVHQAVLFLEGKTSAVTARLHTQMNQAAEALEFEEAARLRDQLQALTTVQNQQFIDSSGGAADTDILAAVEESGQLCIHVVAIRSRRRIIDSSFFPANDSFINRKEFTEAFVSQYYLGKEKPQVFIGNFPFSATLQAALSRESPRKLHFVTAPRGERRIWLKMAERNAQLSIAQKVSQSDSQSGRRAALAKMMGLPEINRLECFDISHTFGEATVASCVVYDNNAMQHTQYRRFNIKSTAKGDDYTAMREALTRRYRKLAENAEDAPPRPDAVIIDGGKGQVRVAREVWADLALDIPIIGIAKGPERRAGKEDLILPSGEILNLPPDHPALLLLQTVRDESHRFAVTGHRKKRAQNRLKSELWEIPGIGPKRRRSLLTRFGGLRGIQAASMEELAKTEGISADLAEKIYRHFHTDAA